MKPKSIASAREIEPTPCSRSTKIRLRVSSALSSSRDLHAAIEHLERLLDPALGEVARDAADARVVGREPRPRQLVEPVPEEVAPLDREDHDGHGAQLEAGGADQGEVVADPVQLGRDHPQVLCALGHLDAAELLDRERVPDVVHDRGDVVEPVRVREDLRPRHVLAALLEPTVEEADLDLEIGERLTVELRDRLRHAVRRRVRRPEVQRHPLRRERRVELARLRRHLRLHLRLLDFVRHGTSHGALARRWTSTAASCGSRDRARGWRPGAPRTHRGSAADRAAGSPCGAGGPRTLPA